MTYREMIIEDTGCPPNEADMIEDIMRNEIFHSTLDWQTRAQLRKGAREAYDLFKENRVDYEAFCRGAREMFQKTQRQKSSA